MCAMATRSRLTRAEMVRFGNLGSNVGTRVHDGADDCEPEGQPDSQPDEASSRVVPETHAQQNIMTAYAYHIRVGLVLTYIGMCT